MIELFIVIEVILTKLVGSLAGDILICIILFILFGNMEFIVEKDRLIIKKGRKRKSGKR